MRTGSPPEAETASAKAGQLRALYSWSVEVGTGMAMRGGKWRPDGLCGGLEANDEGEEENAKGDDQPGPVVGEPRFFMGGCGHDVSPLEL